MLQMKEIVHISLINVRCDFFPLGTEAEREVQRQTDRQRQHDYRLGRCTAKGP